MSDTCFIEEEKVGGGELKEIKQQEKITNWSYSDNKEEDKDEDKVKDKGSKPEKKSKKTKKILQKKES